MSRIGLLAPMRRYEDSFASRSEPLFSASGGNLGNFAFVEALWRHLSPHVTIVSWQNPPAYVKERCDILVVAAANQLGAHTDLGDWAKHLERIGLPLVVAGLGAQAEHIGAPVVIKGGTERFARVLDKLGLADHAVVTGCPSNFLNDTAEFYADLKLSVDKARIDRLCVAGGSPYVHSVRDLEPRLAQFVEATGGAYVVQDPLDMMEFARGEGQRMNPDKLQRLYNFLGPGRPAAEIELWRLRHVMCFNDATSWLEAMRNFDFAVGARFHGVMLAIQAGTPGGVIVHDSRTAEMCETMAIPMQPGRDMPRNFGLDDLRRLFAFDVEKFAATRERLRETYLGLLRGCGLKPNSRLAKA